MKTKKISIFCVTTLLFTVGCNRAHTNIDNQQVEQDTVVSNTLLHLLKQDWDSKLDSMLYVAATARQDTNLAQLYIEIGDEYFYHHNEFQKAKEYYLKTKELSEKLNWNEGRYQFAACYTDALNIEGLIDSSIVIHQQALELAKKEINERKIAAILTNLGNCYNYKRWYETALEYYHEALPMFEKRNDKFRLAHLSNLMGIVYGYMGMKDEQLAYSEKACEILDEKPDTLQRAFILTNYALALVDQNELEKAEKYLTEALRICTLHNNRYYLIPIYSNLANIALRKYDLDKSKMYNRQAMSINLEFNDVEGYCVSHRGDAYIEMYRGNFSQSEKDTEEALKTAIEYDLPVEEKKCYTLLSDLAMTRHDFRTYRLYAAKVDSIESALMSEKTIIYAKEMQTKYETEKKELKIANLEKEKRLIASLGITGGAVLLLALASFFFLWRWTIQKKRIAEQQQQLAETRVKQLEQEKQLIATQAVLDGETRERTRLARDLHDGLGSMLTGVRLNLLEMKKGAILEYADVERFDKVLGLLDESVHEMRRVAHHLMPDSLSRFGLKPAVEDFCRSLSTHIIFDYFGNETRLDPKLEVVIYRCIHELVNNALKYSDASQIMVQIMQESDRIAFTVQDDGCGFDPSAVTKGAGLQNIHTRIASFGGNIQIDSKAGEGTEVNVELKIMNYES